MDYRKVFEEGLLKSMDVMAEQSGDKTTKLLADLFKSVVLEKYKDSFYQELEQGKARKDSVDGAVDFYFSDICVSLRRLPDMSEEEIENTIKAGKLLLPAIKKAVLDALINRNIEIIR